jgi:hypothetical protein
MSPVPYDWPLVGPVPGDSGMPPDPIWTQTSALQTVDHLARALDRLAEQYKGKPNLVAVLKILTAPCADLEVVFQQLLTLRTLDTATGAQIDQLERILKQPKLFPDDATRRIYLKARIFLNLSSGTWNQIIHLFQLVLPAPLATAMFEEFPAAFVVRIVGGAVSADLAGIYLDLVRTAKDGGVRGILEWSESSPSTTFVMDTVGQGFDQGHFSGAKE